MDDKRREEGWLPEGGEAARPVASRPREAASLALERWLLRHFLQTLGNPDVRIRLWDGREILLPEAKPEFTVSLGNRAAFWRLLMNGELAFGEEYMAGNIELTGDPVAFVEHIFRRMPGEAESRPRSLFGGGNTLSRARDNIRHHYDIGNEFYRLWLDGEMAYTCAYFPTEGMSLEAAQVAKMDHICRKLRLRAGERVVEAGCGWGGLARHMARHFGVKVRAFNISREQIAYARERARREGLEGSIEYVEDDFRNISGEYDAFVSVGMLEHVGVENYPALGEVIRRSISGKGRGLIHTIGQHRPEPIGAWLDKHIFPGAYPPTLREMMEIFEPHGFAVVDVENLRLHYAETLRHWLERFEHHTTEIQAMFDAPFVRAWRLYLCSSIACFTTGRFQLYQVLFGQPADNEQPRSRAHLHQPGR